jgi:hypothetical protein
MITNTFITAQGFEIFQNEPKGNIVVPDSSVAIDPIDGVNCAIISSKITYDHRFNLKLHAQCAQHFPSDVGADLKVTVSVGGLRQIDILAFATKRQMGSVGGSNFELLPKTQSISFGISSEITKITGVIVSGPELLIPTFSNPSIPTYQQPVEFEHGRLRLRIRKFVHTSEIYEQRSNFDGSSAATHWFEISALDGGTLADAEIQGFIDASRNFLNFIGGTRVGIGHLCAYNRSGAICGLKLGVTKHDPVSSPQSWFDHNHTGLLAQIFPRFCLAFIDQSRNLIIRRSIEYYNLSNINRTTSLEAALILSNCALETLLGGIANTGQKKLRKAEIFRIAARQLNLASDPAEYQQELQAMIVKNNWRDGYRAIAELRNTVTHADKIEYTGVELHQAWVASQWLFETSLLIWIGYESDFSDRRRKHWLGERHSISDLMNG